MINIKKSGLLVLLMALVIGSFAWNPPKMQCIKLLNNNQRVKVSWSCNDCAHFRTYYFYVNGILADSLFGYSSSTQNYTLCDYGSKEINIPSPANYFDCYIMAVDSNDNQYFSDTIHSINLTVTPQSDNTMAYLEWESPTSTLNSSWGSTFDIYKKRAFEDDFPISPFASVPNTQLNYTDTSDVCDNTIYYQVSISNFYSNNEPPCSFMTTIGSAHLVDSTSPAPPVLDSVSVTPDNEVILGFHETEPYMMAFIIYYINPNGTIPLDTVYGQTYWIDPVIDPNNDSRFYRIATMDSCGNVSPMINNQQCNMGVHLVSSDACHRSATIQWTTYTNLFNDINHFEVLLSNNNGATWETVGTTTSNSYLIEGLEFNQEYRVFVRVVNNGETITASSNRINFHISAEESEDFTYISSVSVIDNQYIQIKVLTSGDTLPFETITLQRSENGTDFEPFKTQVHQNGTATYIFYDSLANFERNTYYYRTFVINHCHTDAGYSNISHNILLRGENNAQTNLLSWHGYDNWDGDVSDYFVMRKVENEELFNAIADVVPSSVNNFSDDISQLFESGSKFLYYIEAKENTNQYGIEETSYSNLITVIQPPTLYIPNAFRPLGANNKVFKPSNSFVSIENYKFSIFTRTGECIFMTTNPQEGWDGRINGIVAPMNVYVYYIEYMMPDGTILERTGTVTLVR